MEGTDKLQLLERTRSRNAGVWINLDWGGLLAPLEDRQAALNALGRNFVENYLAVSDEAWQIKESQRDRGFELDQKEISQERRLAEDKAALGREQLAIKTATDEYVLAVKVYDAKVRALLMGAREYAAQVEREQLAVERDRAQLAIAKEELHLKEVNAKVYFEAIQRAQVEADLARAQVDVAKAHVRALMADIEAGKAEIDLVEAQVQQYAALAEKATLHADVAAIYAEILTKKLSEIKLDVGRREIEAGFSYIQSRLADMLAIWDTRTLVENLKEEAEKDLQEEIEKGLVADKAHEDLRAAEFQGEIQVGEYEIQETAEKVGQERTLIFEEAAAKTKLANTRANAAIRQVQKRTWAQELENRARRYVHKNSSRLHAEIKDETMTISGG
jgi:hypothetical protein